MMSSCTCTVTTQSGAPQAAQASTTTRRPLQKQRLAQKHASRDLPALLRAGVTATAELLLNAAGLPLELAHAPEAPIQVAPAHQEGQIKLDPVPGVRAGDTTQVTQSCSVRSQYKRCGRMHTQHSIRK